MFRERGHTATGACPVDRAGAPTQFQYGFAKYAGFMNTYAERFGAKPYALHLMDYGAPVGYRLAPKHPERVSALIVQNGNAYTEGLRLGTALMQASPIADPACRRNLNAVVDRRSADRMRRRYQRTDGRSRPHRV